MLLSIAIGCILIVGYQGLSNGEKALKSRIYEQLTSVRETRGHQVETWYRDIKSQLMAVSENHNTIYAMREFGEAFERLSDNPPELGEEKKILENFYDKQFFPRLRQNSDYKPLLSHYLPKHLASQHLQLTYIAKNSHPVGKKGELITPDEKSYYNATHAHYHPGFRQILDSNQLHDLFLIDIDSGNIVYSVAKETEYATSLKTGPYRNSSLGLLYHKITRSQNFGETLSADFEFYKPAYGQPAMFLGTTIFDLDKRPLGILIVQVSIAHLDEIMTGRKGWEQQGLGRTGETFLVGEDRLMRSTARPLFAMSKDGDNCYAQRLYKNLLTDKATAERICQFRTSILLQKVDDGYIEKALHGESGTTVATSYAGNDALVAYKPLYLGSMKWAVVAQLDSSEANAPIRDFQKELGISAILIASAVTFIAMLLAALFIGPLNKLMEGVRHLGSSTGDGDLHIDLNRNDEYGELAKAMNKAGDIIRKQAGWVADKEEENYRLLLNILPEKAASRFKAGDSHFSEYIDSATVTYIGIKGLNKSIDTEQPGDSIQLFNQLIEQFDSLAKQHEIDKIKIMGNKYLAACGINVSRLDHARRSVIFARALLNMLPAFNQQHNTKFSLQIGIHCDSLLAGVTGKEHLSYDLWGDAVRVADYLHYQAEDNTLLITQQVYTRLDHTEGFSGPLPLSVLDLGEISIFSYESGSPASRIHMRQAIA